MQQASDKEFEYSPDSPEFPPQCDGSFDKNEFELTRTMKKYENKDFVHEQNEHSKRITFGFSSNNNIWNLKNNNNTQFDIECSQGTLETYRDKTPPIEQAINDGQVYLTDRVETQNISVLNESIFIQSKV